MLLEIRVGRDPSDALDALAARMASKDFEWVVGAIDINREIGGDLALTLDNVAETIRERQRLARHVSALTAEGRLSAYILTGLPVFARPRDVGDQPRLPRAAVLGRRAW